MSFIGYSKLLLLASAALLLPACTGGESQESTHEAVAQDESDGGYEIEVEQWHAQRLERLQREDGWLSLVGLHLLQEGENRIGTGAQNEVQLPGAHPSQVGSIFSERGRFRFVGAKGVKVTVAGEPSSEAELATDEGGTAEPTLVQTGSLRFYVIERGEVHYLRSKDSESEVRRNFDGIERYPVDSNWRVEAKLVAYEEPKTIAVPNILGTSEMRTVIGELVFPHEGGEYRLLPMGEPGQRLFLVFGDAGNGVNSYGGGRFLYTEPPSPDGSVIVDFNLAYNPPCVFTPYATCPLPPPENVLPFEVTAGEKNWGEQHH